MSKQEKIWQLIEKAYMKSISKAIWKPLSMTIEKWDKEQQTIDRYFQ